MAEDKKKNIEEILEKLGIAGDDKINFINATESILKFDDFISEKHGIPLSEVKSKHDLYFNDKLQDPEFQIVFNDAIENGKESEILLSVFNEYVKYEEYTESVGEHMVLIYNTILKYSQI